MQYAANMTWQIIAYQLWCEVIYCITHGFLESGQLQKNCILFLRRGLEVKPKWLTSFLLFSEGISKLVQILSIVKSMEVFHTK